MKKAHRDRDQSVRGHSTLTKVEQIMEPLSPSAEGGSSWGQAA